MLTYLINFFAVYGVINFIELLFKYRPIIKRVGIFKQMFFRIKKINDQKGFPGRHIIQERGLFSGYRFHSGYNTFEQAKGGWKRLSEWKELNKLALNNK